VRAEALPDELAAFPAIEYLSVPGALVHTLESAMVPKTVRVLHVSSDESTKYALHPKLELPQLDYLAGFTKLAFRAAQVPNLTKIEVKLASAKMPAELATLPLRALGVGPVASADTLAPFAKLALTALSLRRGNAASLAGVELFPKLEEVWVKGMDKLRDVSALAKLRAMRAVTIEWCTKLSKVDALGDLPKLVSVNFWASKMPRAKWRALAKTFEARGVKIQWPPE
jgi:hypothetical protein